MVKIKNMEAKTNNNIETNLPTFIQLKNDIDTWAQEK